MKVNKASELWGRNFVNGVSGIASERTGVQIRHAVAPGGYTVDENMLLYVQHIDRNPTILGWRDAEKKLFYLYCPKSPSETVFGRLNGIVRAIISPTLAPDSNVEYQSRKRPTWDCWFTTRSGLPAFHYYTEYGFPVTEPLDVGGNVIIVLGFDGRYVNMMSYNGHKLPTLA